MSQAPGRGRFPQRVNGTITSYYMNIHITSRAYVPFTMNVLKNNIPGKKNGTFNTKCLPCPSPSLL